MNTRRGVYTIFFSNFYSSALILASKSAFEAEPTCLSTSLPSLKKSKVGILRMVFSDYHFAFIFFCMFVYFWCDCASRASLFCLKIDNYRFAGGNQFFCIFIIDFQCHNFIFYYFIVSIYFTTKVGNLWLSRKRLFIYFERDLVVLT